MEKAAISDNSSYFRLLQSL